MAGATAVHRPGGFFATSGGFEYPAYLGFVAAALGVAGPGRYSLDHLTGHRLNSAPMVMAAFAASTLAAAVVVGRRESVVAAKARAAADGESGDA
jgi:putative oxidoreductase